MANPVWKKVTKVEPGMYWHGGSGHIPNGFKFCDLVAVSEPRKWPYEVWYARIGDVPPEPEMPPPELKDGDRVMVRDREEDDWRPKNFARWSKDGFIMCWREGTEWSSGGCKFAWNHYRLPTPEELAE